MKKELLKMAGVKTEKEFYNLYPTPEDFFAKYPEARNMVQMKNGGIPKYKNRGLVSLNPDPGFYSPDLMTNPYAFANYSDAVNPNLPSPPAFITIPSMASFNPRNTALSSNLSKFIPADVSKQVLEGLQYVNQKRQMGGQEMSNQEAAQMQQAQQQGAGPQQQITEEQIVQFVAQALASQELSKEQILQVLVNEVGLEEEQAAQLIQAVEAKLAEQAGAQKGMAQQPQQQMMKYGGYSGTYDAGSGSYFKMGGNADAGFQVGSVHNLPQEKIDDLIKKGYKVKYI